MPELTSPLTEMQVRNAKPRDKPYKLFDGGGLYLDVLPSGSRIWRFKYRQPNGKENRLTFGPYPELTLQEAREKRLDTRLRPASRLGNLGSDPHCIRRASRVLVHAGRAEVSQKAEVSVQNAHEQCWKTGTRIFKAKCAAVFANSRKATRTRTVMNVHAVCIEITNNEK